MAVYTHDFKFEFDGNIYDGEIEFNSDGIASFKYTNSYELTLEQQKEVGLLMDSWHRIFHAFGGTIKLLRLKEKVI